MLLVKFLDAYFLKGDDMSIMGLRASAQEIRYAILEKEVNEQVIFSNRNSENRIKYPANIQSVDEKLEWVKKEIDRILRIHPQIEKIYIKTNEYGNESTVRRETTYVDAIFLLTAKEHNIEVERKLNSQISSTATKAKELAESRIGRTEKYWNNTMADAVLVAYWGITHDV